MSEDAYTAGLGVRVEHVDGDGARIRVPFQDANSNPGGALHGGVAASMIDIAAVIAARAGTADGLGHGVVDLTVDYLAAAIREDVVGTARVLRRGKELAYVAVDVATDAGKAIATGLVTHRSAVAGDPTRQRHDAATPLAPAGGELPSFVRFFTAAPFMARLGLAARVVRDGLAQVALPWQPANTDAAGCLHDGALAALVDTTAAMASWSLVPLDPRNKASTVGLHVCHLAAARDEDVVAQARTLRRNDELFMNVVEVQGVRSARPVAIATVTYRIVVPVA
ncbi:MAG TPA: hotdog fold thioesterase [Candidatus Binatia bacterium]|jgi:uncharacterized protein (TIGR00369 family)|nr:hotdog fold thioesterase [Candidatus Binatia bacterium]